MYILLYSLIYNGHTWNICRDLKLHRYFWCNKQDTQNTNAFSVYKIVDPMLIIVHNVICHVRAFLKYMLAWLKIDY